MNDFFDKKKCLVHPWADLDETLRVYRVDPKIFNRHIFDFRSKVKTGSQPTADDIDSTRYRFFSRFIQNFSSKQSLIFGACLYLISVRQHEKVIWNIIVLESSF